MYSSMNCTYQNKSMQHAFDASISGSSDSSRSSISHNNDLEPESAMDGRNFYPITDEFLSPIDIVAWDCSMELEESALATLLKNAPQGCALDRLGPSTIHITDGEISDNSSSSVSTEIFECSLSYDLEPHSVVFPSSDAPSISIHLPKLPSGATKQKSVPVSPFVSPVSSHQSQNDDGTSDGHVVSLSAIVSSQDRRFKPFHEEKWSQRYEDLLAFHKQNGHAAVPHTYPPHQQLARWIKR
jgi:hypothetical protein